MKKKSDHGLKLIDCLSLRSATEKSKKAIMFVDQFGLPTQENGDANDQLQRVGMILVANDIGSPPSLPGLAFSCFIGMQKNLQPKPGTFRRHTTANPNNCSADQIVSALCALLVTDSNYCLRLAMVNCIKRLGFAQNYMDGLNDSKWPKIPDFMWFRAAPIFMRTFNIKWLHYFADLYLIVLVLGDWLYLKTDKDPADINNTLLTLATCLHVKPTAISRYAARLWPKLRKDISFWLQRYHRRSAGGNPEIAYQWEPIIAMMFYGVK